MNETTIKILPLGDSITEGTPFTYRYALYKKLKETNLSFDLVGSMHNRNHYPGEWDSDNEGHSGWTTHDISEHLDFWLEGYTPDVVLLHIGTNDVAQIAFSIYNPFIEDLDLNDSLASLKEIIKKLRRSNPSVTVYLAKILPIIDPNTQSKIPSLLAAWNVQMEIVAETLSTNTSPIYLVDMYSGFSDANLTDGVHPNENGATKMAEKWVEALFKHSFE